MLDLLHTLAMGAVTVWCVFWSAVIVTCPLWIFIMGLLATRGDR